MIAQQFNVEAHLYTLRSKMQGINYRVPEDV